MASLRPAGPGSGSLSRRIALGSLSWLAFLAWWNISAKVIDRATPEWCESIANRGCLWSSRSEATWPIVVCFLAPLAISFALAVYRRVWRAWMGGGLAGLLFGVLMSWKGLEDTSIGWVRMPFLWVAMAAFVALPSVVGMFQGIATSWDRAPGKILLLSTSVALSLGLPLAVSEIGGNAFDLGNLVLFMGPYWLGTASLGMWFGAWLRRTRNTVSAARS